MLDYLVNDLHHPLETAWQWFLTSELSARFEQGDCSVLVGMSGVEFSRAVLEQAGEGEYCFVENTGLQAVEAKIEKIIVFWWNRHYPSDRKFDLDLSKWNKVSEEEFAGYSHEKITKEVYEK